MVSDGPRCIPVLHVDDEAAILDLTKQFLEREEPRLRVESVDCPLAALASLEAGARPACVLCDYRMPTMDGLAFLEAVVARWPSLPVILYSAGQREEIAPAASAGGAVGFVRKESGAAHFRELARRIISAAAGAWESAAVADPVPADDD